MAACPYAPCPWPGSAISGSGPPSASPPPKPFQTWCNILSHRRFRTREKHQAIGRGFWPGIRAKTREGDLPETAAAEWLDATSPAVAAAAPLLLSRPLPIFLGFDREFEMFDGKTPKSLSNPIDDGLRLGQVQGPSLNYKKGPVSFLCRRSGRLGNSGVSGRIIRVTGGRGLLRLADWATRHGGRGLGLRVAADCRGAHPRTKGL
jgi:hypothetical protein